MSLQQAAGGGSADGRGWKRLATDGGDEDDRSVRSVLQNGACPSMGTFYVTEARRFIRRSSSKGSKTIANANWDIIKSKLMDGPQAAQLRRQLSPGRDGDVENAQLKKPIDTYGATDVEAGEAGAGKRERRTSTEKKPPKPRAPLMKRVRHALHMLILSRPLSLLLIFLPLGFASYMLEWGPGATFFLNFLGLIPLAAMLGDLTEEVAEHTGDTVGGIVNASFGNLVEMLIGVQALLKNEFRVVQASMLGSVLSNLLLVTGTCFLVGGIYNKEQRFNAAAGVANVSLLFLATLAVVVPNPIGESYDLKSSEVLLISRVGALFLLSMYLQLIFFQIFTHKHLFEGEAEEGEEEEEQDDEEEDVSMTLWEALFALMVVAVTTGLFSEMLVDSIDGMSSSLKISKVFVGVILLPLVGNATEHLTAVTVAVHNRMELAMGIAVGSATQVAIFVIPFLVLVGWAADKPMSLSFPMFEVIIFVMSVMLTIPVLLTATSNWLLGSFLVTSYLFCGFAFWFEKERDAIAG